MKTLTLSSIPHVGKNENNCSKCSILIATVHHFSFSRQRDYISCSECLYSVSTAEAWWVCVCVCVCLSVRLSQSQERSLIEWRGKLRQSKQRENLCWHSAATRWPVNANFNNSLIIGVRAPLDHFALREQARQRREGRRRASEIGILSTEILMKYEWREIQEVRGDSVCGGGWRRGMMGALGSDRNISSVILMLSLVLGATSDSSVGTEMEG